MVHGLPVCSSYRHTRILRLVLFQLSNPSNSSTSNDSSTCYCCQVDKIFRIEHTDPWLRGDRYRTSRTVQLLNNRTSGAAIHGRVENEPGEAAEPAGEQALCVVDRLMPARGACCASVVESSMFARADV